MTRVTFVTFDDEPAEGGQGVVVRGLRRALMLRGHKVSTISGRGANAVQFPRVTGRAPLDFSLHLYRRPALITSLGGEVVHAQGGPGGVLLLRDLGVPLVYTAHHTYRQAHGRRSPRRLLSVLEARAYQRAGRVMAVSRATATAVRGLGVADSRVEVLPPGVDLPGDPRRPGPSAVSRREPARLLFAGRWEPEKGVLDAVAIMRKVLSKRPMATALIAGSGSLDAAVRRAAAGSAIEMPGRLEEARLWEEYARAAIVLMPSRYEGLGLVALEAQAAGAVVVGFDIGGLRDAVRDGVLVGAGAVTAAVHACLRLIDDPQARDRTAERARLRVRTTYSWDAAASRLEIVYAELLGRL